MDIMCSAGVSLLHSVYATCYKDTAQCAAEVSNGFQWVFSVFEGDSTDFQWTTMDYNGLQCFNGIR